MAVDRSYIMCVEGARKAKQALHGRFCDGIHCSMNDEFDDTRRKKFERDEHKRWLFSNYGWALTVCYWYLVMFWGTAIDITIKQFIPSNPNVSQTKTHLSERIQAGPWCIRRWSRSHGSRWTCCNGRTPEGTLGMHLHVLVWYFILRAKRFRWWGVI